jgi:hypothetical protein
MTTPHPYAEALQWVQEGKYAEIEFRDESAAQPNWRLASNNVFAGTLLLSGAPNYSFRLRPPEKKFKLVNGIRVPMHETQAPPIESPYWIAYPAVEPYRYSGVWLNDNVDQFRLERCIVYLNPKDAVECGKAMAKWEPCE